MAVERSILLAGAAGVVLVAALFVPVGGGAEARSVPGEGPEPIDLSAFSPAPVTSNGAPVDLLFIHHSCGGQLLAPPGEETESPIGSCIYTAHPNGGDLRAGLEAQGYRVHEASYHSAIGDQTDLFDWLPKLRDRMGGVLRVKKQDEALPEGRTNHVVAFKSCFPNNLFRGEGTAPGDPAGPELTVWNARATLAALLPELAKHPDVLFVYVTAPPNAPRPEPVRAFRALVRLLKGQGTPAEALARSADLARQFNDWVVSRDGWLRDYRGKNVVVFDYYDILTGHRASNLSVYATGEGRDAHPSAEGNRKAAEAWVPFLNRAVRRAGIVKGAS
jgi:hypothetical protein